MKENNEGLGSVVQAVSKGADVIKAAAMIDSRLTILAQKQSPGENLVQAPSHLQMLASISVMWKLKMAAYSRD